MQQKQFISLGMHPEQLPIVGNARIPAPQPFIKKHENTTLRICFAGNNIDMNERHILFSMFANAVDRIKNIDGMMKIHPAEQKAEYQKVSEFYPHIKILESKELSNKTLFENIDLLLVHNSTIMIEAIGYGVPVLIINHPEVTFPIGIGQHLLDIPGYPQINTSEELEQFILAVQKDDHLLDDLFDKCLIFIHNYCKYYGDESVQQQMKVFENRA